MASRHRNPDLSVVVPIHNGAVHLVECVQSVLEQKGVALELICVDDDSTDGSWEILRRLRRSDARVRLARHPQALGLAAAKNTGIEQAAGRYVQFTNVGDLLPPGALSALYRRAVSTGAEVVRGSPQQLPDAASTNSGEQHRPSRCLPESQSSDEIRVASLIELADLWIPRFFACFLYSREFLYRRSIRFPALTCGEDSVFLAHALSAAERICVVPEPAYLYRVWDQPRSPTFDDLHDYFARAEMVRHIYGRRFRACWEECEPYVKNEMATLAEAAALDERESRWVAGRLQRFSADRGAPLRSPAEVDATEDDAAGQPALSVIIPCRNAAEYLSHQLDAVTAQDASFRWELIIVDNGSTDGSGAIAESYADRRPVRLVSAPGRANLAYTRNVGARAALADKLVFVDADDEVAPGFLAAMYEALDEYEVVTSLLDEGYLNTAWSQLAHWVPDTTHGFANFILVPPRVGFVHRRDPDRIPLAFGCAIGITRDALSRIGGFSEEFNSLEDVALSVKLHRSGVVLGYLPGPLIRYRLRDSLRGVFQQARRWGCYQARAHREFGAEVLPSRSARVMITEWTTAIQRVLTARSRAELAQCAVRLGYCVGRPEGSVRYRTLYL